MRTSLGRLHDACGFGQQKRARAAPGEQHNQGVLAAGAGKGGGSGSSHVTCRAAARRLSVASNGSCAAGAGVGSPAELFAVLPSKRRAMPSASMACKQTLDCVCKSTQAAARGRWAACGMAAKGVGSSHVTRRGGVDVGGRVGATDTEAGSARRVRARVHGAGQQQAGAGEVSVGRRERRNLRRGLGP